MKDVRLYYIHHQGAKDFAKVDLAHEKRWLSELPASKQKLLNKRVCRNDRLTSLFALQLLNKIAIDDNLPLFQLKDIVYPPSGKPFWSQASSLNNQDADDKNNHFNFNITHSENLVVVVASHKITVGVDVEKIRPLKSYHFERIFSTKEIKEINNSPQKFFEFWSAKEAVVKAANTRGWVNMHQVKLDSQVATFKNYQFQLTNLSHQLKLKSYFSAMLASSNKIDNLKIKSFFIDQL